MSTPVVLPGATGSGYDVGVLNLAPEQCWQLCSNTSDCEAAIHVSSGIGTCWGKKDVHTSAAEGGCQTQNPYITMFRPDTGPWGKCTAISGPHIATFDRKMLGTLPPSTDTEDLYMAPVSLYDSDEFILLQSPSVRVHTRVGYTEAKTNVGSSMGVAVTGSILGGQVLAMAYVGPEIQDPSYKGWRVMYNGNQILASLDSNFISPDKLLNASFKPLDPTNYAVRAPNGISTQAGLLPSMVFEIGGPTAGPLQIYVLPGPDFCNVVITMRRDPSVDGYCGNFNCNWDDDSQDALLQRRPDLWLPVPNKSSLFPPELDSPVGWDVRIGPAPKEVMGDCSDEVKQQADCDGSASKADKEACIFDACMVAFSASVGSNETQGKFDIARVAEAGSPWLGWWPRRSISLLQGLVSSVALVGSAAVLYLFRPDLASTRLRPSSYIQLPTSTRGRGPEYERLPVDLSGEDSRCGDREARDVVL